jgi:predicted transcriptional regulator
VNAAVFGRDSCYFIRMNKIVESILERVADWPEEAQAELMQSVVEIETRHMGLYKLSDEERAAVRQGLDQAARGEFVADDVVAAFFQRHRA